MKCHLCAKRDAKRRYDSVCDHAPTIQRWGTPDPDTWYQTAVKNSSMSEERKKEVLRRNGMIQKYGYDPQEAQELSGFDKWNREHRGNNRNQFVHF